MSENVKNQRDLEVCLEEQRGQLQFQERAREIVIRDAEILAEHISPPNLGID